MRNLLKNHTFDFVYKSNFSLIHIISFKYFYTFFKNFPKRWYICIDDNCKITHRRLRTKCYLSKKFYKNQH